MQSCGAYFQRIHVQDIPALKAQGEKRVVFGKVWREEREEKTLVLYYRCKKQRSQMKKLINKS